MSLESHVKRVKMVIDNSEVGIFEAIDKVLKNIPLYNTPEHIDSIMQAIEDDIVDKAKILYKKFK